MNLSLLIRFTLLPIFFFASTFCSSAANSFEMLNAGLSETSSPGLYSGSSLCRECHEKFHQLWATSWHGLAMQRYSPEFAVSQLSPQEDNIVIGNSKYRVEIGNPVGWITETGEKGSFKYPIIYVLGGKNVYYFLTSFERGRLQTLPIAYDVANREWFDTSASAVRFLPGEPKVHDRGLNWKEWPYTFNTACFNCHVSQLKTNYDITTDSYNSSWTEPGINCETCHGPAGDHIKAAKSLPVGQSLKKMRIIRTTTMTINQRNDLCATCHSKMVPLTNVYTPGDRFFDHFDLMTLEDPDFYPDGRDLGENYTFTAWLMSPCAQSGKIDCMHCHTSSGRYRFKAPENANNACMPCHTDLVKNASQHSHHKEEGPGNRCIACHMPTTSFARMKRSDHSMRPPTPGATLAFKSPNACNNCHSKNDAAWADKHVRNWYPDDYQAAILKKAALIEAARKHDWNRLPEMLAYINGQDRDPVFAASLIRLLKAAADPRLFDTLCNASNDASPLVRAAAIDALASRPSAKTMKTLLAAAEDPYRVVRIYAGEGLALMRDRTPRSARMTVDRAIKEYERFLTVRPDIWTDQYNLGNYYFSTGRLKDAIASYERAIKLEPRSIEAMVNASMAYARLGKQIKTEHFLKQALSLDPDNPAVNFDMGLLMEERRNFKVAELFFRKAIASDPALDEAAQHLCLLVGKRDPQEAEKWCKKARALRLDHR